MDPRIQRKRDLEAQIREDYDLLKQLEDTLRYEDNPKRQARLRADIRDLNAQITARQTELDALTVQLHGTAAGLADEAWDDLTLIGWQSKQVTSLNIRLDVEGFIRVELELESGERFSALMAYDSVMFAEIARMFQDLQRWAYRYSVEVLMGHLERLGRLIYEAALPRRVKQGLNDLQASHSLLLSMDTPMANIPWELAHDGTDFLGLRYAIGRQTYLGKVQTYAQRESVSLKMLVLGPPAVGTLQHDASHDPEVTIIRELCDDYQIACQWLVGDEVTALTVLQHLYSGYDIIHIIGHLAKDGLLLSDGNLLPSEVMLDAVSDSPPALVTLSACETGREEARLTRDLAESGITVIGSYTWIGSECSTAIMSSLYAYLFEGCPIGEALRRAKLANMEKCPEWWGLVLYGNPSLILRR